MKLLVTGGAGYVGSVTAAHLVAVGHEVTVLDNLSTGHRDAVPHEADFVEAELIDVAALLRARPRFDGVLHFAAKSLVAESTTDPSSYWLNNVAGTRVLLDSMREAGIPRLVFSSTAATYGEPGRVPISEADPSRPTNAYGATKLAVDLMLADEARAHGLAAVSLRYFNVAGAWGRYGERHTLETHLIPLALRAAAQGREASAGGLTIYGRDYATADGTCIRDYVHVADLAEAHLLALDASEAGRHKVYNLGSGRGFSVLEVIAAVGSTAGRPVPTSDGLRRPGDPAVLIASNDLVTAELGWTPARSSIEQMVADAWSFFCSQPAG